MDIWKEVLAGIMVWAITAGIAWLVGNIPIFRRWLATHPLVQQIAINVLVAGLVSSIVVVIYGRYFASLIEVKASGETKVEGRILTCPEGQFIAGWTFQDQPGLAHGALWAPSAICRKVGVSFDSNPTSASHP
jgi:hypothetical protein